MSRKVASSTKTRDAAPPILRQSVRPIGDVAGKRCIWRLLALAAALLAFAAAPAGLRAEEPLPFQVIVHASNPVTELSRSEVSRLFLRQVTRWEHGHRVLPVNLVDDSPLRQSFAKRINNKSLSAEKAYWQRRIFTGRGVPPVEVTGEDEVLAYVERNSGAIGYVSTSADVSGVRTVAIVDSQPPRAF